MAKEIIERLIDDLDGSEAHTSIRLELDGHTYVVDLNADNEDKLRRRLGPFVQAARRVRKDLNPGLRAVVDKGRGSAIRQWALAEGVELPSRGRIAGAVQDAFDAKDVAALYTATGLEQESEPEPEPVEEAPKRRRRRIVPEFSAAE